MEITSQQLQKIMPRLTPAKRALYLPFLNHVITIYEIDKPLRCAAFLAQLAHESGEFRYMEEIWGPTPAQNRYEPPSSLAQRLGNIEPGDGKRFKGRGPIQITGRENYKRYGDLLGVDLISNPELAATPQIAFSIAGLFWEKNGLNNLADIDDFDGITRRINGGLNGIVSRRAYYKTAKAVLTEFEPTVAGAILPRGLEAIWEEKSTKRSAKAGKGTSAKSRGRRG